MKGGVYRMLTFLRAAGQLSRRGTPDKRNGRNPPKNSYKGSCFHTISIVIFSFRAIAALHRFVSSSS